MHRIYSHDSFCFCFFYRTEIIYQFPKQKWLQVNLRGFNTYYFCEMDYQTIFNVSIFLCYISTTSNYYFWGHKKINLLNSFEFKSKQLKSNTFIGYILFSRLKFMILWITLGKRVLGVILRSKESGTEFKWISMEISLWLPWAGQSA